MQKKQQTGIALVTQATQQTTATIGKTHDSQDSSVVMVQLALKGMHCTSCAFMIDGDLEDTPGVISAQTNYAKAITSVTFDRSVISVETIQSVIESAGYQVAIEK